MKTFALKTVGILLLFVMSFSLMSFGEEEARRPFIGQVTTTHQEDCGSGCICTYATTTQYIFWINVGTTTELTGTDCSGALNP